MISEELLQSFIAEASDLLDDAESSLVEYPRCESEEEQTEIVNRVFRHFHSIKGSAGFVGLHDIALLTHEAETLLEQYRKNSEQVIPQQDINLLCRTVDLLRAIFATGGESSDEEGNDLGLDSIIQEIKTATKTAKQSSSESPLLSEVYSPTEESGVINESGTEDDSSELPPSESQKVKTANVLLPENEEEQPVHVSAKTEVKSEYPQPPPSGSDSTAQESASADSASPKDPHVPNSTPRTTTVTANVDMVAPGKGDTQKRTKPTRRVSSETARIIKGTRVAKINTSDFAERYVTEANELLEQIEQSLLHAEQHPEANADSVQEALRCLHSFKGNSGFMNLVDLERLSHRMESEVEHHTDRTLGLDSQTFDALLQMIDVLRQGVHDFSIGGSGRIPEADAYIEMMDEFVGDQYGTRYQRSKTTDIPMATTPADKPSPEGGKSDTPIVDASPKEARSESPDTRRFVRNRPVSSDTTRMVLMGTPSTQVNLSEAPKAGKIIMPHEDQKEDGSIRSNQPSGTTTAAPSSSESQKQPAAPTAAAKTKHKKANTASSDTAQKRRNQEQLAARNDIRVDLRKLDSILDLVGELVIAEAMVTRHPVVWNAENESLERAVHQLRRVSSSLQDMATSVRMIPLAPTFRRMTRLVYDLSVKAGKQVDLILLGEDTEVDRTVIERISDPLVHIIRNAIDHGIESPEERRRIGKPETGRLTIEGHHEGGEVWIIITDDGCGLNRNAILSSAISKGLVQGDGSELSDREVYHFIFEPGFSTANRVTDISGRGFGMDVVKKNIEKLSGRIDIQTRPGEGTAVVMRIPLTLAIIDGMLVSSGENRYIIPLLSIRESLRPEAEHIVTTPDGQQVLKLRGDLIPIVKLGETFSRSSHAKTLYDGILMIVEGEDGDIIALFADELVGQQETVIKGLSGWLKKSRGVSGYTILGDGEVGLILDIGAIVRRARETPGGQVSVGNASS